MSAKRQPLGFLGGLDQRASSEHLPKAIGSLAKNARLGNGRPRRPSPWGEGALG